MGGITFLPVGIMGVAGLHNRIPETEGLKHRAQTVGKVGFVED
jgi:hypothetical protein